MPNFLISHRGTIAGVEDEFTHTLVINAVGTAQDVAETCRDLWRTDGFNRIDGIRSVTAPTVTYTEVAAAEILSLLDGDLGAAYHAEYAPGDPVGGIGAGALPAQTACCVSLTAGNYANGTPIKGRFYLPVPEANAVSDTGLFGFGYQTKVADSIAAYFSALSTVGYDVGVWSRSQATFSTLTSIRVGNRPDTIRTRRNSAPEEYVTLAV